MRIVVFGGRDFGDRAFVFSMLNRLESDNIKADRGAFLGLIHGCAPGVDTFAAEWQSERIKQGRERATQSRKQAGSHVNFQGYTIGYPAMWNDLETPPVVLRTRADGSQYNAAAGGIRNQKMIDEGKPQLAIAFPGGSGTADMVGRCIKGGIPLIRVTYP